MAVALTVSETLDGTAVSDALANGGNGVDLGSVTNGQYAPIVSAPANTGAQILYIRSDATVDPVTEVKTFIQTYGTSTGFSYGGADSAANDYATLVAEGNASGSSKNNSDDLSSGLWIDMDSDVSTTNQFDQAGFPSVVKIYGDNNTDGIDLASGFTMAAEAMVVDNGGEQQASAPIAGQIGKDSDLVLGDNAKIRLRIFLRLAFPNGGILQWEWVIAYSFTA